MKYQPFTLVELLVTMVLLAVLLPVLLRAVQVPSRLLEAAAGRRTAAQLADSKLRELVVTRAWQGTETAGDWGTDHPGYHWELATARWNSGTISLYQLQLTVTGPGRAGPQAVTLTTLVQDDTTGGT